MAQELQRRLQQGESETLEFKRSLGELREIVETVGAFANARGGTLLIGVDRDGQVVGVQLGRGSLESLANAIQQNTDPKVLPSLSVAALEGRTVIVVEVPESPVKPVFAYQKPFKRVGRSNHILAAAEVARLAMESYQLSWDAAPMEASLAEIAPEAIRRFLQTARKERNFEVDPEISPEEALEKLHLLHEGRLTRAALLLFGRDPQKHFPQAEVRCARFRGTEPLEFVDMQVIGGTLMEQVPEVMRFLRRNLQLSAEIKGLEREERWEYPLEALREAVVNAVCHRDYASSGEVQVRLFDDRLEVWNPGTLPEGLSPEDLRRAHDSRPRNKLLAQAFFLLKYIEQWGTGTLRMIGTCRDAGFPEPEFTERATRFVVTFHKSKLTREYLERLGLSERQLVAVEYVKSKGRITNREYVQLVGVSRATAARDLSELVQKGILRRRGEGRGSYFELRE